MAEPVIASRKPFTVDVEAGKEYWWCACGRSRTQPFCDGSHKGTGFSPIPFKAEKSEKVWFCGCKHSGHKPMCDGTHKTLPAS
jgi:CDGSH-type Zn-finger protein